jgi:hypothetical protein
MLANSSPTLEKCYPNISYRIAARIIINPLEPVKVIKQENNMGNTDAFITELKALLKKYNMCDENEHNEHKICIIGTSYIPPYDNPTGIQFPYPPRESYNFAIHRSNGRKYVGGSVGPSVDGSDSANQTKAVRSAIFVAKKDGYTHYRLKGTDEIYPLDSE